MMYENNCLYESHCQPDISVAQEIVASSIFTIGMVGLILVVLTAFSP